MGERERDGAKDQSPTEVPDRQTNKYRIPFSIDAASTRISQRRRLLDK